MSNRFHDHDRFRRHHHRGDKGWFGVAVVLVGIFLLLKKLNIFPYFDWQTIWPIIMIAVGIFIGVQKKFRNNSWWVLILIGSAYLIPEFKIGDTRSSALVLPAALIIGGAFMIFRSKKKKDCMVNNMEVVTNNENLLNIDVTFGGRKEMVTSKEFKGGNIAATFAGVEINMIQADNKTQSMVLDLKVSFSGVELVVPSHWELQNEIVPTFGGVEDHRSLHTPTPVNEEKRVLILRGTCNFGSVEIKSY